MAKFQIEPQNTADAVLVFRPYIFTGPAKSGQIDKRTSQSSYLIPEINEQETGLREAGSLCQAIGLEVVHQAVITLKSAHSATLIGSGKIKEIAQLVIATSAKLVLFDHQLSPRQQFKLEKLLNVKVLDRTGIILEIFGKRARTKEGRIQVELAHLEYQKTRLVRSWTHLERQRGGGGFLGGPGETQLESDKRQLQGKIESLKNDLRKISKTRQVQRSARGKGNHLHYALVGYTNAGKSSIFNVLASESILARDMLFATLDPTIRGCQLPSGDKYILSDTVGFIQDLPTHLVDAFKATLEEVIHADTILHVRDCSSPMWEQEKQSVLQTLKELGINANDSDANIIEVWNKYDLLNVEQQNYLKGKAESFDGDIILSSAVDVHGLDQLTQLIAKQVNDQKIHVTLTIPIEKAALVSWLYSNGMVINCDSTEDGAMIIEVQLNQAKWGLMHKTFPQIDDLITS